MNLSKLFKLAKPIVQEVERQGKKVGATGVQKRGKAVEVLSAQLAGRINDKVNLPPVFEAYTDDALGLVIDGVVDGFNSHVGTAWGSRLDFTHVTEFSERNGERAGVSFEIKF